MKRLLLLALALGFTATTASAQVPRRVLIEKFTNTGCPPCATTDPIFEEFENTNLSKIAVVKYHTSGPDNTDPFYNDKYMKTPDDANKRAGASYYAIPGVPHVVFDGVDDIFPSDAGAMTDIVDGRLAVTSPFEMSVTREVVGDSLFANVTVKAVGAVPTNSLRFAVIFTERFNPFKGNNGSPFHTDIVRDVVPGFATNGQIITNTKFPTFEIAAGETKTIRYGTKILADWNVDMFGAVAFVQDFTTKEVYQSAWTFPEAYIEGEGGFSIVNGSSSSDVTIHNPSPNPLRVKVVKAPNSNPSNWTFGVTGTEANDIVTIPAASTKNIALTMNVTGPAKGNAAGEVSLYEVDEQGNVKSGIFGVKNTYFGAQTTELVVDAGTGAYADAVVNDLRDMDYQVGQLSREDLLNEFSDWSQFDFIFYAAGLSVGLYSDDGSWDMISDYLAQGGNILATSAVGPNAYKLAKNNSSLLKLWRDNFGVEPDTAFTYQSGWNGIVGQAGDPITGNYTEQFDMAYNLPYLQTIGVSGPDASPILYAFSGDTIGVKAIHGKGKSVFMGIGLEYLADGQRADITKKIIDWFNGVQAVKISNDAETIALANYPNPFNPSTTIEFSVTEPTPVTLVVKDMMGREVATLIDFQMHEKGTYSQKFDASNLASGTYMYELTAGSQKITKKMTLNK